MTLLPSRRTVVLAAGSGMASLVLAACGLSSARRGPSTVSTAASIAAQELPTTGVAITVPPLSAASSALSSTTAATRRTLPLTPTSAATRTTPTATPTPTPTPTPSRTTARSTTTSSRTTTVTPESEDPTFETSTSSSTRSTSSRSATRSSPPSTTSSRPHGSKLLVVLDPGHNGGNEAHPEIINQSIDGGYGYRNVCNTTGTSTNDGYAEHLFTWNVANLLKPLLEAKGITVLLTRDSDSGVGPCTNVRARMENEAEADAVVSIHGDGVDAKVEGFYVLTATRPPAGTGTGAASLQLARAIRDGMVAGGFPASNTLGSQGLWTRDDLTGLNKSTRPKILIECGNMRNAEEAGWMASASGQRRYAKALAAGTIAYLKAATVGTR